MPRTLTKTQQITILEAENKRLKRQLRIQKKKLETRSSDTRWRTYLVFFMATLAGILLLAGNFLFWSGRALIDNENYTKTAQSLIKKPAIQQKIADKSTDAIFRQVDTERLLEASLPGGAQFIAPTISSQVRGFTNNRAKQIVASQQFENTWTNVNRRAHSNFIDSTMEEKSNGTIDISGIYTKLVQDLQNTRLSFLANIKLPDKIGSIQVVSLPDLPRVHWLVANFSWLRAATMLLFGFLVLLTILVAVNRRKIIIWLGISYASILFLFLIALRVAREVMVARISSPDRQVFLEVWQAFLGSLVWQTTGLIILCLVVAFVAWGTGSGKKQKSIKRTMKLALSGKAHKALFAKENKVTRWLGKYKRGAWWLSVVVGLALFMILPISVGSLVWLLLGVFFVILLIELSAAPK